MRPSILLFAVLTIQAVFGCAAPSSELLLQWGDTPDRPWPGPDLWGNRVQDWEVTSGRLTTATPLPMRTAHILTCRSNPADGEVQLRLTMGLISEIRELGGSEGDIPSPPERVEAPAQEVLLAGGGVLLGAGGAQLDFRRTALIHHSPGPGGGLFIGLDHEGRLAVADFSDGNKILARSEERLSHTDSLELIILLTSGRPRQPPDEEVPETPVDLELSATPAGGERVDLRLTGTDGRRLAGGIALASHGTEDHPVRGWFASVALSGEGLETHPDRSLGPILGAQHILDRGVLTLTAQLFPISPLAPGPGAPGRDTVLLETQDDSGRWAEVQRASVTLPGYTARFRVQDWPRHRAVPYRLSLRPVREEEATLPYSGVVRPEPLQPEEIVVAAFTGNHNVASPGVDRGAFDWSANLWFPHEDIVGHVLDHDPDFLFFSGDQVYEGASPTQADFEHPYQDYLYKWYLWLWAFRDLTSDIPSVAIPDDHDVFHGNVWGAGGIGTPPGLTGADAQDQGGYRLPPDWVNMVQRTQTSHLPAPRGPSPLDEGIEVYYTDILFGGVSFAVLEDRKFKSPPKLLVPEADVWNGWAQNPAFDPQHQADPPGASLLGSDQEAFLEDWAADWADDVWMKVVLSQTIFGNVATIPEDAANGSVIPGLPIPEPGDYVTGDKLAADMDSNGWPPSGRDRALRAMRKGFAVHLAGDQHLASTIQYGVDGFRDGPYALCVPSVANFWPRRWFPPSPGGNRSPGAPAYTGDHLDGFGNPMTVFAVSNPARWNREPPALHDRAPGYGIARFNRATREITLEAWPRWSDPSSGGSPYPGWPVRFHQEEGYGKEPWGYLPTLVVEGLRDPVVQVRSELGGQVVYTTRIRGTRFTPRVFEPGSYSVSVGEPGTDSMQTFLGWQATADSARSVEVRFGRRPD